MTVHKQMGAVSARTIAAMVLERVERDGAFAAAALDAELERAATLDDRDRALATELTYGVLRTRAVLEERLGAHASLRKTDAFVRAHLLVAAYQILLLDRVPSHAAVDAAVTAVRARRGGRVGGFVNAVLRKLSASERPLSLAEAIVGSAPAWLLRRLTEAVGHEEAAALLGAGARARPDACVRLRPGHPPPGWLAEARRGVASPLAWRLQGSGDLRKLPGFAEGAFVVQEEGAQVVALSVGARAGESVLDACAGRGQKATLLADQVGAAGRVVAADLHPHKLAALVGETARLGLGNVATVAVDWTIGAGAIPDGFDRVLVDAPCTGVGTLRRRPEIARRLGAEDPDRLGALSEAILRRATTRARPGGRVVFAVCSVLPEEGRSLVERVTDVLEPTPFDAPELAALTPAGVSELLLLPSQHGTEGYFVASFVRKVSE